MYFFEITFYHFYLENQCYFLFEKVIICSRNETKAEEAIKYIKQESGNDSVQFCHLDLASLKVNINSCNSKHKCLKLNFYFTQSVRKCAETLLETEDKIDYLINNAGLIVTEHTLTEDGFEMHIGANHLGHFLFTELVLPLVRKSAASGFHPRYVSTLE